jgi:hypothetical protein
MHTVHHAYVHDRHADDTEHSDDTNDGENNNDNVEYPSAVEHDFLRCISRGAA